MPGPRYNRSATILVFGFFFIVIVAMLSRCS